MPVLINLIALISGMVLNYGAFILSIISSPTNLLLTCTFMPHHIVAVGGSLLLICAPLTSHPSPLDLLVRERGQSIRDGQHLLVSNTHCGKYGDKPLSLFPFHSPPISSPPPLLYTSQTEHCMISYIFECFAESETQQMQIFFCCHLTCCFSEGSQIDRSHFARLR